jgi:glycosyltransferase involved in cell wall biosynthesis
LLGVDDDERIVILPPMIASDGLEPRARRRAHPPRLAYSGKFSPPDMILEMLSAFDEIRDRLPSAQFHVIGDKFSNVPRVPRFASDVTFRLITTPGVIWHSGVHRAEVPRILQSVDVAASWRGQRFDDSIELSSSVLEYAALGLPVLTNPSAVHLRLFGPTYPGYVQSQSELVEKFLEFVSSAELYEATSALVRAVADRFTFPSILRDLMPVLNADVTAAADEAPPTAPSVFVHESTGALS